MTSDHSVSLRFIFLRQLQVVLGLAQQASWADLENQFAVKLVRIDALRLAPRVKIRESGPSLRYSM